MECDTSIAGAERASRGRAILMSIAAAVLLPAAVLQWGEPAQAGPTARGGLWVLLILPWILLLANGGGLRMSRRMRALLNDELSLRNRDRALAAGFYATLATALALHVASWWIEILSGDAIRLVTALCLATALALYSWLEWR